jgi:hypothetical protein
MYDGGWFGGGEVMDLMILAEIERQEKIETICKSFGARERDVKNLSDSELDAIINGDMELGEK